MSIAGAAASAHLPISMLRHIYLVVEDNVGMGLPTSIIDLKSEYRQRGWLGRRGIGGYVLRGIMPLCGVLTPIIATIIL